MASDTAGSNFNSVVYPQGQVEGFRTLSVALALTASTIISYCFAQRAYHVDFFSRRGVSSINITKWLLLMLFLDSWAFVFLSGVLVNGIGMSLNPSTCSLGVFACIIFYCISKLLTYLFLLEKVYIVWPGQGSRLSSIPYRIGFCAILGFIVVLIMMVIGRIAYLTEDNRCIIGLQKASSMTTLFVDLFVNILLTSLFLWPLWRSKLLSPNIRRVASRTLVASFAALTISAVNLSILTVVHGQELGWVCLASCSTDVVVNAMVLFWLTRPSHANDESASGGHAAAAGIHGPTHNNRSENGKSIGGIGGGGGGGGVVQMHRISVTPGMHANGQTGSFNGTSSINGTSRSSTGLKTPAHTEEVPRSPMKVNFSGYVHTGVYDGSQPSTREWLVPSHDDTKTPDLPDTPTSASFPQPKEDLPSFFKDQKRHSVGFLYEKKVTTTTTSSNVNGSSSPPSGFFNKLVGKRPAGEGGQRSFGSIQGGFGGGRKRGASVEDNGVRITITTMLENDDTHTINAAEASPNSSSEDQSKKGPPRVV